MSAAEAETPRSYAAQLMNAPALSQEGGSSSSANIAGSAQATAATDNAVAAAGEMEASASNSSKLIKTLVIDTNPLLKGLKIGHISEKYVTVPEVLQEVRSKGARSNLESLLLGLDLEVVEPDVESLNFVTNFSKMTGDFASLAIADLRVLALTYMLERKSNGADHLHKEPVKSVPKPHQLQKTAGVSAPRCASEENPAHSWENGEDGEPTVELAEELEKKLHVSQEAQEREQNKTDRVEEEVGEIEGEAKQEEEEGGEWHTISSRKPRRRNRKHNIGFGGGWITPENLKQQQVRDDANIDIVDAKSADRPMDVACMTADFAMQNVLLQVGLNLVSPDGAIVKQLKTWVQRCQTCTKLVPEMEKKFCPSCGHSSLTRVAVSVNSQGELKVHLKRNYQYRLKGTKYSIPKPKGGRVSKDIILREDEKAFQDNMHKWKVQQNKVVKQQAKAAASGESGLFDLDYVPSMWLGPSASGVNKNVATYNHVDLDARGLPVVGYGRKNPNVSRKTGNRKNKKH
ncbi:20S-pre-rRNA D-site endonuclease nob1 [Spiromyces aspiralis]|uniref:20S-pre-rRNA D-site endonuclease nob1 n=1 Tax=Spiromyces aspiralis TaxID=68401 RepID=A0ACC1I0U3_9FUNG|nr:20S-pre-rRNA D-site endonuclease nob1 [Spiromyces aspiralis]